MNRSETQIDAFGGIAGRVLRETMSLATFVSGCTLVLVVGTLAFILNGFEARQAAGFLFSAAAVLTLARYALNGYAGEWGGTLFSSRGGGWLAAGMVALRYAALSMVWIVPTVLLGWRPGSAQAAIGGVVFGGHPGKLAALTVVAGTLLALSPPVFLIVSVGAERFLDLVDPKYWRRLFSGRQGDLHLIYTLYLGALGLFAILATPALIALAGMSRDAVILLAFPLVGFAVGLAMDLLGRLCGFFAAAAAGSEDTTTVPAPGGDPAGGPPDLNAPARTPIAHPAPTTHPPASPHTPRNPSGKTPLLEARERVNEQLRRFENDPEGAIAALVELAQDYAPQPLVLHALTLGLARAGHERESLIRAREALPLCLERGALRLAAEIYAAHLDRADAFDLPRDAVLSLALDLRKTGNLDAAEAAYARVFEKDAGERRAVKGLLQVAESLFEREEYARSRGIYLRLLEGCPDSPLAQHMRDGLEQCDRRLAKAS